MDTLSPITVSPKKNLKVWGVRQSLIGDSIMAIPLLTWAEKRFPGSYKYWQIARKCSQSAPIYLNHPLIDQIVISDCNEGMGPRDIAIAQSCDIRFNTMPDHPEGMSWPNRRTIFEETWVMAGVPLAEYHAMSPEERRPKLTRWFDIEKQSPKTVAIWPCAGYGIENKRNASQAWYQELISKLIAEGCVVYQLGHPRDYTFDLWSGPTFRDLRKLAYFDQIKLSLGCDLTIGTDSGTGLVLGAYGAKQITLLTNHWPGHVENPYAFATNNPNNTNFFGAVSADNIDKDAVVQRTLEMIALETAPI